MMHIKCTFFKKCVWKAQDLACWGELTNINILPFSRFQPQGTTIRFVSSQIIYLFFNLPVLWPHTHILTSLTILCPTFQPKHLHSNSVSRNPSWYLWSVGASFFLNTSSHGCHVTHLILIRNTAVFKQNTKKPCLTNSLNLSLCLPTGSNNTFSVCLMVLH